MCKALDVRAMMSKNRRSLEIPALPRVIMGCVEAARGGESVAICVGETESVR